MSSHGPITARPRIAVAGATGRVGAALVGGLAYDAVDIVALSRRGSSSRLPVGTNIVEIDFDRPASLLDALTGTERLFLAHGTSDQQVGNEIAMIDAAVAAGVSHIVKLSAMGPPTRLHPFDWHMRVEAHLAEQAIGYTVLRPSCFVDVLARAKEPVSKGTWGGTAGAGRVNLIDTRDVADVARIALLDGQFLTSQRAYHLTGPKAVSMPDIADELSSLVHRPVPYAHRTPEEHRDVLIASGTGEMVADLLLGLDRIFLEGVLAETTTTVAELTGREARSTSRWLHDNISGFVSSSGSLAV
ncbi:NAD(P)H-binding protein [Sphingomonas sp. NBWT7]|uniref:NAD(P)H-binding protein n=1 Tax=Sphingomonas sp. NBWT7 TaxID=2596913 RepID=UPI00162A1C83|nr:NAD(P)H-binding protein [Sphingomonas sp. NBWT7]QNE31084.1 NAD(P)H-binding protein [Sphingomonas sp. NBWT7]